MNSLPGIALMLAEAVKTDEDLAAWTATHYNTAPTVMVGRDNRDELSEDECPVVVVLPGTATEGESVSDLEYEVGIVWSVFDEGNTTSDSGIRMLTGAIRLDEMRILIARAIETVATSIDEVETDEVQVDEYPLFTGVMAVTMRVPNVIGAEITIGA